jgi:uncharacterized protein
MPVNELTGNDYVSLPSIAPDCGIDAVNVIHAGLGGLVEWTGGEGLPLLRPEIAIDGDVVSLAHAPWRRLDRWIPSVQLSLAGGITLTGTICAPGGYPAARGFLLRFDIENSGRSPRTVDLRLHVHWQWTRLWIASPRPLAAHNALVALNDCLCLDADGGRGPALAIATSFPGALTAGTAEPAPVRFDHPVYAPNGEALRALAAQTVRVDAQRRTTACFFVGAGRERDGAVAAAAALRRAGPDNWMRQARLELSHMVRPGEDPRFGELLNRNLIFNRYFAVGRGIDDDRIHLLRSRSTRCPAPALFNEREALFWTLPALMLTDPGLARESLFRVLETFSERSGERLRYIDGGAYDPAIVMDQLLLYPWIIDHYRTGTGDDTVLDEPLVRQVVAEADAAAFHRLHPRHMLCSTELLPSGEPADHPYATFANVLLRAFADALPRLWTPAAGEPPLRLDGAASEIAAAVWHHCTTDVGGVPILASSTSLEGDAAVYDDPAGSLALLPFFGFCPPDDPIWRDTMDFLRSDRYPLWRRGAVPGLAARSDPAHARLSALCADLLGPGADGALDRLRKIRFTDGIAAAHYRSEDGDVDEVHFASLAGLLAWTLVRALEPEREPQNRRGRR